jgi:hypothetical protein
MQHAVAHPAINLQITLQIHNVHHHQLLNFGFKTIAHATCKKAKQTYNIPHVLDTLGVFLVRLSSHTMQNNVGKKQSQIKNNMTHMVVWQVVRVIESEKKALRVHTTSSLHTTHHTHVTIFRFLPFSSIFMGIAEIKINEKATNNIRLQHFLTCNANNIHRQTQRTQRIQGMQV